MPDSAPALAFRTAPDATPPCADDTVTRCCRALGLPPLAASILSAGALSPGAAGLLVHERGMTATLAGAFGEPMGLSVLRRAGTGPGPVWRLIRLYGMNSGRIAELGMIEIDLQALPLPAARAVLAAEQPFGTVLAAAGIRFRSSPDHFLGLAADPFLAEGLAVPEGTPLYGRSTRLTDEAGTLLARAVEILADPG